MDPHRRAELRSLALHAAIVDVLRREPERLLAIRQRVQGWLDNRPPRPYAKAWANALDGEREQLWALLVDPGERANAMRQASPFAGVLDARTRWRILETVGAVGP